MPEVEDDPFLLRRENRRIDLALDQLAAAAAGIGVRVDVAGSEHPLEQLLDRPHARAAEVDHHGDVGDRPRFNGPLVRRPFRPIEVRTLDADDDTLVLQRHIGRRLDFHVGEVLLDRAAAHPVADDVEEGGHAGLRFVDDASFEVVEVPPSRTAGIRNRRHAASQREGVDGHAEWTTRVRRPLLAVIPVNVDVDQAGRDIQPRGIDGFRRLRRRDVRGDGGDPAILDGDVANGINPVPAVDDVAPLEQQVVRRLGAREARHAQRQQKHNRTLHRHSSH